MATNSHNNINGDVSGSGSGSASSTGADRGSGFSYLIVRPEKGGIGDLYRYLVRADMASGVAFLEGSDEGLLGAAAADHRWVILVSIIVRKIITFFRKPMEWTGYAVDFFLNLLFLNGNLFGLLCNLLHGRHYIVCSLYTLFPPLLIVEISSFRII